MPEARIMAVAICGLLAWLIAVWVERNAARLGLVQEPNHRSSHHRPTPAGGGLGIAVAASLFGLWVGQDFRFALITALSLGFAAIGYLDDARDVPFGYRFAAQAILLAVFLAWGPVLPPISVFGMMVDGLLFAAILLFVALWWVNLFNFMDGIDGIAAMQAIFMLVCGAVLAAVSSDITGDSVVWWMWAAAFATIGFLVVNFPPARVFMGDTGSNYLAFMVAALALSSVAAGRLTYATWAVLASLFVSDATVTLVRRMWNREPFFAAHRQHAYQRLSRRLGRHRPVTLGYLAANVLFVAPMAYLALATPWAWPVAAVTYAVLLVAMTVLGAGRPEHA